MPIDPFAVEPEEDVELPIPFVSTGPDLVTFNQCSPVPQRTAPAPVPPPPPPPPPPPLPPQNGTFVRDVNSAKGNITQANNILHQRTGHAPPPGSWAMRQALQRQVDGS